MDEVVGPICLTDVDVVAYRFNRCLVGSFGGSVGLGVVGRRHTEVDTDLLEQLLPKQTHEQLVSV
jgi:hypothetical protein